MYIQFGPRCVQHTLSFPFAMRLAYTNQWQGRMLLENLLAAHMKRIRTDSKLRVKLHKTKRKLAESPAIDLANTFECVAAGCASRSRRWLRCK